MLDLIKGGGGGEGVEEFLGDTLFSGEMEDIYLYHDKVYLTPPPPLTLANELLTPYETSYRKI